MPNIIRYLRAPSLVLGALALSACAFDDLITDDNNVSVFTTHHATPVDGVFPDRGGENYPRIFDTDTGWRVALAEAWVVTSNLTLVGCNQQPTPLDMYWGPLPEDMTLEDLDNKSVGGARVPGGTYCGLIVEYGPYTGLNPDANYEPPEPPEVVGATIYLAGSATRGSVTIPFQFRSTEPVAVELDVSTFTSEGGPLVVENGPYPEELTISKTYDRFFDGVEFDRMDEQAVQGGLLTTVRQETRVALGKRAAK